MLLLAYADGLVCPSYSLRIYLVRAIASSRACSGLIPSGAMRWIAFGQTNLSIHEQSLVAGPVSRRGAHYAASYTGTHARMTRRLIAQDKLTKF